LAANPQDLAELWPSLWQQRCLFGTILDDEGRLFTEEFGNAGIAQLVEHLICNHLRTQHSCGLAGTLAVYLAVPFLTVLQPAAV
jgi:hypothetical protein